MFAYCTVLHCTVPLYIVGAFAAVYIVTAVMFHSCVVCAVTAGDVVNSQLARLRAMILVYSAVCHLCVFLLIHDSVRQAYCSETLHVRNCTRRGLSFPQKPASAKKMQLPQKDRREISCPTPEKAMLPHIQFPPSGSTTADAALGCEPDGFNLWSCDLLLLTCEWTS